jgi:hypothetical protein
VIALFVYFYNRPNYKPIYIGERTWNVIADYKNSDDAAKMLSSVHNDMLLFMKYLISKYRIDEFPIPETVDMSSDKYRIVSALVKNYNPDEFYENDPRYSSDTSFTKGKGQSMYICVRNRNDPEKLVSRDMLFFVMLHEMAHIGNYNGWGHNKRYWSVFKFLLEEAKESTIYKPINWAEYPTKYCGLDVKYNPLFDNTIVPILN